MMTHLLRASILLLALTTATACSSKPEPAQTSQHTPKTQPKAPKAQPVLDRDGVPLESGVKVREQPLPVLTYSASKDPTASAYKSRFSYDQLVKFYTKKLPDYKKRSNRTATKFTSPDGLKSISIIQPDRRFANQVRVLYTDRSGTSNEWPEDLKDPRLSDPAYQRLVQERQERLNRVQYAKAAIPAGPSREKLNAIAEKSGGGVYNRRVETRPDGTKVIVLVPRDAAHSSADFSSSASANPSAKPTNNPTPSNTNSPSAGAKTAANAPNDPTNPSANAAGSRTSAPGGMTPAYIPVQRKHVTTSAAIRLREKHPYLMF